MAAYCRISGVEGSVIRAQKYRLVSELYSSQTCEVMRLGRRPRLYSVTLHRRNAGAMGIKKCLLDAVIDLRFRLAYVVEPTLSKERTQLLALLLLFGLGQQEQRVLVMAQGVH